MEAEEILRKDGYTEFYVINDSPGQYYPDHTHDEISAHIILEGEMDLVVAGVKHVLKKGDRFDVPGGAVHNAKMGLEGCKYLVGEK